MHRPDSLVARVREPMPPSSNHDPDAASRRAASIAAGWVYMHSATLNMEIAVHKTVAGPEVWTADKVYYSPEDLATIRGADSTGEITPEIHIIKRLFSKGIEFAEVVRVGF